MSLSSLNLYELAQLESEASHNSVEEWLCRNTQYLTKSTPWQTDVFEATLNTALLEGHADTEEISYFDWDSSDEGESEEDVESEQDVESEEEGECEPFEVLEYDGSRKVAKNEEDWSSIDDKYYNSSSSQCYHQWTMMMYSEMMRRKCWMEEPESDPDRRSDEARVYEEVSDIASHSDKRHVHNVDKNAFDPNSYNAQHCQYCTECILSLLHQTEDGSPSVSSWTDQKCYFARISQVIKEAFRRYGPYRLIRRVER